MATGGSPDRPIARDSSVSSEPLSLPDPTGPGPGSRMPAVKNVGEPCAGKPDLLTYPWVGESIHDEVALEDPKAW
jgi:hypothetical protein